MSEASILERSILAGQARCYDRSPEPQGNRSLPPGTTVVSTDGHWSVSEDIFYERFPSRLRDKAPRIVRDEGLCDWVVDGVSLLPPVVKSLVREFELVPGSTDIDARLKDLDAEGVDKEIAFGNGVNVTLGYVDLEVREAIFRVYNEHLAEIQARAPGRFYGVAFPNFWQMSEVRSSLDEIKSLGLKTVMLPINPYGANREPLNYCAPGMEPLWAAIEESGLPVCFHVGEYFKDGPGGVGTTGMVGFGPFRKALGELIFGGIFDRHPGLRVVFTEAEINWVPGALHTATMLYHTYSHVMEPKILNHPAHYWRENCYATFTSDPAGMKLIDDIGTDRVMWSSDYPHQESTFGNGWTAFQEVLDAVSLDDARKMLGGTAMDVFNLH